MFLQNFIYILNIFTLNITQHILTQTLVEIFKKMIVY